MSEEQKRIVEEIRRREQDIEIMKLLLKHRLTKKRAEYKLLIMYYKACNVMARAKLAVSGIINNDVRVPSIPKASLTRDDAGEVWLWDEKLQRRASRL